MKEDVLIFEMSKGASLRDGKLRKMPGSSTAEFLTVHKTRSDVEATILAQWQKDERCRSCKKPMTATKLAWTPKSPLDYALHWFSNLSPDRIKAGGRYTWDNIRLVCTASS